MNDLCSLERAVTRELYRRDFHEFFRDAFPQLLKGGEYDENWHAKYLCDQFQAEFERIMIYKKPKERDILVNMPIRSSKSLIISVVFPVWCWIRDPRTKFITVSFTEDLAMDLSKKSNQLLFSAWFKRYFSDDFEIITNTQKYIENDKGGFRKAVGTSGSITGFGSDIIILDDPQSPMMAASERERENTKNFHDKTLSSRLNYSNIGVFILVMQRLHEEDLSGYLLRKHPGRYQHICLPACIDDEKDKAAVSPPSLLRFYEGGLFWPNRFDRRVLKFLRESLGVQSSGQLQQRPSPLEGNLIKWDWLEIVDASTVSRNPAKEPIDFFLDTAYTEKQENSPTGVISVFKRGPVIYVTNAHSVHLNFPDLIKFVQDYVLTQGYGTNSRVFVEPKASGLSLIQQFQALTNLNIVKITSEMLKDDKLTRLSAISAIVQSGKVKLLHGVWNDSFLEQLTNFPNARHDEYVDLLSYAVNEEIPPDLSFLPFLI